MTGARHSVSPSLVSLVHLRAELILESILSVTLCHSLSLSSHLFTFSSSRAQLLHSKSQPRQEKLPDRTTHTKHAHSNTHRHIHTQHTHTAHSMTTHHTKIQQNRNITRRAAHARDNTQKLEGSIYWLSAFFSSLSSFFVYSPLGSKISLIFSRGWPLIREATFAQPRWSKLLTSR